MQCPSCGNHNQDGTNFCVYCGNPLQGEPNESHNAYRDSYTDPNYRDPYGSDPYQGAYDQNTYQESYDSNAYQGSYGSDPYANDDNRNAQGGYADPYQNAGYPDAYQNSQYANQYVAHAPKKKSRTGLYVTLIVILVLLIGVCGFFLFKIFYLDVQPASQSGATAATIVSAAGERPAGQPSTSANKEVTVPNVTGMTSAAAYQTLSDAGLKYKAEFEYSDSTPQDYIMRQTPLQDAAAKPGDTVTITISRGAKPAAKSNSNSSNNNDSNNSNNSNDSNNSNSNNNNSNNNNSGDSNSNNNTDTADIYGLHASQRYLTQDDIAWMDLNQVQFAINEIYAKHGFRFTKGDEKAYFESMDWYNPDTTDMSVIVSRMNAYEVANIKLMGKYRDALK